MSSTEVQFTPYLTVTLTDGVPTGIAWDWTDTCQGEIARDAAGQVLVTSPLGNTEDPQVQDACSFVDDTLILAIERASAQILSQLSYNPERES